MRGPRARRARRGAARIDVVVMASIVALLLSPLAAWGVVQAYFWFFPRPHGTFKTAENDAREVRWRVILT